MNPLNQAESGACELPRAKITRQSRLSLVWVVPLVAALVAGWLVFKYVRQLGPVIRIQFSDANEIKPNQTTLRYRGVQVGEVLSVQLTPDAQQVEVRARLDRSAAGLARAGSVFWIVRPEVGAGGLHGLETIVSGSYIQVEPGGGGEQTKFIGAEEPPLLKSAAGGLEIILTTPTLGSLSIGAPVYYRGLAVGTVQYYVLANDSTAVNVHLLLETNFAPLVRMDSKFWNAGGISAHFGLFSGLSLGAENLKSLVIGGIAFATPSPPGVMATNGAIFPLNDKADSKWLDWSPAIIITNAPAKASPSPPASLLLNGASLNAK